MQDTPRRVWIAQSRNGYTAVDEHHPHEGTGTYGAALICRTRAQAELSAGALNQAYALGARDTSEYRRVSAAR